MNLGIKMMTINLFCGPISILVTKNMIPLILWEQLEAIRYFKSKVQGVSMEFIDMIK